MRESWGWGTQGSSSSPGDARVWGMRPSSSSVRGGGLGVGVGDARVVVTVVNTPVLGWWLLLSLAGRQHGWWGGGGGGGGGLGRGRGRCVVDADGGVVVVVGHIMVTVIASLMPVVGWSSSHRRQRW